MFKVIKTQSICDISPSPVGGIEEQVCTCTVLWSYPFLCQYPPKSLHNIQMRGVCRKEEDKATSLFINRFEFLDAAERPAAFKRTARQCTRKRCFSLKRKFSLEFGALCLGQLQCFSWGAITNSRTRNPYTYFII